ncbi:hypothetical protein [Dubosiella newyorkensis]|uniref:hypothetical protein n=1 Tax=Dubosiella newyorkensis TaxID=1862672 RepID=UPI0032B2A92D
MKKKKKILFVDTENIGIQIPETIKKRYTIYFYLRNRNILPKIYPACMNERVRLVDLSANSSNVKNEMDLVLLAQLSICCAKYKKKRQYVILSKDKGYDRPIELLSQEYGVKIRREEKDLKEFLGKQKVRLALPDPAKEEVFKPWIDQDLFRKCKNYNEYRNRLGKKKRNEIRIDPIAYRGANNAWIEYDPYQKVWIPYVSSFALKAISPNKELAIVSNRLKEYIKNKERNC